jgi:peptidoglycan/LPS O-acetylase OafA/YrhL
LPRIGVRITHAAQFAVAFGLFYWYFVTTEAGQRADASTLGATEWYRNGLAGAEESLRRFLPLVAVALAGVALLGAALQRRWRDVLWGAALPVVGYGLAGVLRNYVLWRPELGDYAYPVNTLPTGRVVATVALLVVAIWLAPPRLWTSPMIVVAALLAGGVGTMQVATFAHRFADVVTSALLVGVLAALWPMSRRRIPAWCLGAWVVAGLGATIVGTWLVLKWDAAEYDPSTQVAACLGIAAAMTGSAALALVAGTVVPRRGEAPSQPLVADTSN